MQAVVSDIMERAIQAETAAQTNPATGVDAEASQSEACPPDNLPPHIAGETALAPTLAEEGWDFEDLEMAFPVL